MGASLTFRTAAEPCLLAQLAPIVFFLQPVPFSPAASSSPWEASHDDLLYDAPVGSGRTEAEPGSHDLRHRLPGGPAEPVGDGDGAGVLAGLLRPGDRG